ncbi:S-adenosyl-L-methionine-dependent methyltransferase [Thozetella sp. PMI_491]|nr:S-adenosyl-L-methionine-dependent methyltransferase [Thozetella sp. PMI_491]
MSSNSNNAGSAPFLDASGDPNEIIMKVPVNLTGVTETLFIPLAARAADAATQKPILGDPYAMDVLKRLSYDFEKIPMPISQSAGVAIRTRQYDKWTAAFLSAHPRATVLHLACGLDSRFQRIKWSSSVRWIDVDLPEVVALRRHVLPTSLPGRDYQLIGASVTETAWLDGIPTGQPTVVVMEGLLSYLEGQDMKRLLRRLVERFGEGELLFDCINHWAMSMSQKRKIHVVSRTGTEFHSSVENPKELEGIHPRMKMLEVVHFTEARGVEKLPLRLRAMMYALSWIPNLRNSARFVRFAFDAKV